jgi:hypothetical protein
MKDIETPKSERAPSELLDPKGYKSILVCNGVTKIDSVARFVCVGVKLLPVSVAIAERPGPGGMYSCCLRRSSPTPELGAWKTR